MDLITEGQKITLIFQKGSNIVEMECNVVKVFDDRLELNLPQYFMRYIEFLQVGKTLTAKAFSKFGTVDFNTMIISSPLEESFLIELDYNSLKLTPGNEIPKINAIEDMEITYKNAKYHCKTFEITTEDVKFNSDKKFSLNDNIEALIKLPSDYGIIKLVGVISHIDEIYDNEYTAQYITMTEFDRQALLYYMYMYTNGDD
jgi:hypothetical protein